MAPGTKAKRQWTDDELGSLGALAISKHTSAGDIDENDLRRLRILMQAVGVVKKSVSVETDYFDTFKTVFASTEAVAHVKALSKIAMEWYKANSNPCESSKIIFDREGVKMAHQTLLFTYHPVLDEKGKPVVDDKGKAKTRPINDRKTEEGLPYQFK